MTPRNPTPIFSPLAVFRQAALRQQLSLAMAIGVLSIALLSSLASSWQGSRQIRLSMLEQGQRVAESFARQSALALLSGSADNASEPAKAALAFPDVTRVEIHQANGTQLLVRGAPDRHEFSQISAPFALQAPALEAETDDAWRFVAPVIRKGQASPFDLEPPRDEVLGYVRVVQSKATLSRLVANVLVINLVVSFSCAVVFLLLIRILAGRLTRPLAELSSAMARAERGEADAHATVSGPKDVVDMANAYNRMIAVLQEREVALRESQMHYREVVESVREAIFQTDSNDSWALLNPAWEDITGFDIAATLGTAMLDSIAPADRLQVSGWLQQLRSGEVAGHTYEARFIRADGSEAWAEIKQHARFDAQGRYQGCSGTFDDITERKQAEQELSAHRQRLEELVQARTAELQAANKELEAFSYSISHDLRAPLRAVDGFSNMLQEDYGANLPPEAKDYLARIVAAAQRMSQLTDGLLTLARVSRNDINRKEVDLSQLAHTLLDELQASFPQRRVEVIIEPNLLANADPAMMQAVMQNLLSNAWKFTAKREVARIEVGRRETPRGEAFYVRDNGAGFDMAYVGKLFGTFQRLHGKNEYEGTGVGLATVNRIVQRHNGEIWAQAVPDQGATFYFTLPPQ